MGVSAHMNYDYRINTARSARGSATMSSCGRFRLRLTRQLQAESSKTCTIILFCPLEADHLYDDAPTARCTELAQAWGCGQLDIVCLFSYRTKTVHELLHLAKSPDQFDIECTRENRHYINMSVVGSNTNGGPVVCAWGSEGRLRGMDLTAMRRLREHYAKPKALRIVDSDPCAPLDALAATSLIPYTGRAA